MGLHVVVIGILVVFRVEDFAFGTSSGALNTKDDDCRSTRLFRVVEAFESMFKSDEMFKTRQANQIVRGPRP
jgi:hypothetical protein